MNEYEVKFKTLVGLLEKVIERETTYCNIQCIKDLIEVFKEMEGKIDGTN